MEQRTAAVSVRNVTKRFGPVLANDKVCLDIYRGEILALLGENGSGKTTLMNMLSGIYYPDEGEIYINGKPVSISSPKESFHLGIGTLPYTAGGLLLMAAAALLLGQEIKRRREGC